MTEVPTQPGQPTRSDHPDRSRDPGSTGSTGSADRPTRPAGLTQDVGWEIGASRTLPLPVAAVWEFLVSAEGVALWLGPGAVLDAERGAPYETADGARGEVRSHRPYDRIRLTHQPRGRHGRTTTLQVSVSAAPSADGLERTVLRFHQEHLADSAERERRRAHWKAVLTSLTAVLGEA